MPVPAKERVAYLLDENSFKELFAQIITKDPLDFDGYEEKLQLNQRKTGMQDAFLAGVGKIDNRKVAIGVLADNVSWSVTIVKLIEFPSIAFSL